MNMCPQLPAEEAIRVLYDRHGDDVYRYAKLTLGNDADAGDVVQEVFLRAFRAWGGYRREDNGKTWLMRIARNYMFDVFRKRRTERGFLANHEPTEERDPYVTADALMELEQALSTLKPDYRQVVVLRHIEQMSLQEAAEVLGWSETKVRTTTHRAMAKLRRILSSNAEEVDVDHEIRTRHP